MVELGSLIPSKDICVHCGRRCNDFAGGRASLGFAPLCHPNEQGRPDCYHMVTVYHHPLQDCTRCAQDPYVPMSRAEFHDALMESLRAMEQMIRDAMP